MRKRARGKNHQRLRGESQPQKAIPIALTKVRLGAALPGRDGRRKDNATGRKNENGYRQGEKMGYPAMTSEKTEAGETRQEVGN